jgi:hypothetical protein
MSIIDIHKAKTHSTPLTEGTSAGEPPVAHETRRLGFLEGQISVPDDFDQMGSQEIEELFYGRRV